jgi:glycerophosphoryl diester phosphodiesterase
MFGPDGWIRVIGHRGAAGVAPENTLASMRHALEVGVDAIEVDVHTSRDGELMVIHDPTVDRTTDGSGSVAEMSLAEIRELDAGFRFTTDDGRSDPFRGQGLRVPTLDEIVSEVGELPLVVEVKSEGAGRALAEWLPGRPERERIIVGGFERELVAPAAAAARWRGAYQTDLMGFVLLGKVGISRRLPEDLTAVMVPVRKGLIRIVTRSFVLRAHAQGKGVFVWTVNRPSEMRRLFDLGVDGLISDYPAILRRVVDERRALGTG